MVHRSQYQYAIDVTILSSLLLLTLLVNIIIIVSGTGHYHIIITVSGT